jgi:hypothetical protein
VAFADATFLVYDMENGFHRLIVCNTDRVLAFYDSCQFIWGVNGLLLHNLIIVDDVEDDFRGNDR